MDERIECTDTFEFDLTVFDLVITQVNIIVSVKFSEVLEILIDRFQLWKSSRML